MLKDSQWVLALDFVRFELKFEVPVTVLFPVMPLHSHVYFLQEGRKETMVSMKML